MEVKVEVGRLDNGKQCRSAAVTEASKPRLDGPSFTRGWTFITNHTQVLLAVAQRPDLRVKDISAAAGITERHAYRMLRDLQEAGYVERRRDGRCNVYRIHPELAIGDPVVEEQSLRELLRLIGKGESDESPSGFGFARALRAVDPR
jgi:DNA-binding transcriptional ArsR family regulator